MELAKDIGIIILFALAFFALVFEIGYWLYAGIYAASKTRPLKAFGNFTITKTER